MKDSEKPDLSRTSAYVRAYIERLEGERDRARGDLEEWKARNAVGMEESTVVADPYSEAPRPVGRDTPVQYASPEVSFMVEFDSAEGMLTVMATGRKANSDGIAVYPSTGNCIRIKGGRP